MISSKTYLFWRIYFYKIPIFQQKKNCLVLKVNVLFLSASSFSPHLASSWGEVDIYIFFLVRFLCKNKPFILFMAILYKSLCKNGILKGHIFSTNYSTVVITIYCALKIEKNVNGKIFVIFSFL